jgi:hypothetical protein
MVIKTKEGEAQPCFWKAPCRNLELGQEEVSHGRALLGGAVPGTSCQGRHEQAIARRMARSHRPSGTKPFAYRRASHQISAYGLPASGSPARSPLKSILHGDRDMRGFWGNEHEGNGWVGGVRLSGEDKREPPVRTEPRPTHPFCPSLLV